MAQNINKETFEIFESLNAFDSLLSYKLSNSIYNKIFPSHKIVVGTEKNPNLQNKDLDASFYFRQKSYKSFNNSIDSYFDEFDNYITEYVLKKNKTTSEEILISEESKKFLDFFNKQDPVNIQQNVLGYDYGFQNKNFFTPLLSVDEEKIDEIQSNNSSSIVEKNVIEKIEKIVDNKEIFNISEKETKTQSIIEKIWEKKQEDVIEENSQTILNNSVLNNISENNVINNVLNKKTLHNSIVENYNSQSNTTNNLEQNILNEIKNSISNITLNSEKIVESKIEKVVKEIHHQNKADLSEAIIVMKKMLQEEKNENKFIQKNSKKELDKTLEDFLRS